jgi:prepilin-type processing-associated H-X9-DG protein
VPTFYCPTRRPATAYPLQPTFAPPDAPLPFSVGRSDYAADAGHGAYTSGVVFVNSLIRLSDIKAGLTRTYLAGEKNLEAGGYLTGQSEGDNEAALIGDDEDNARWTFLPPSQEGLVMNNHSFQHANFGSAHGNGCHMAFCDGSVHTISYSIDPKIHDRLGDPNDPTKIDAKSF